MKACGVVVEYNPFHNGHAYHLQEARRVSGADVIIAVMSGDFLQRGEPAIVDKWERAKIALLHGADIVMELPFASAVQSADYFASGSVRILDQLQAESICFGTDTKTDFDYMNYIKKISLNQDKMNQLKKEKKYDNMSYPKMMEDIMKEVIPENEPVVRTPNHILGLSYARANNQLKHPMILYPIHREGSGFHEESISEATFASATAIRKLVFQKKWTELQPFVSAEMFNVLQESPIVSWEDYWQLLRYQITSSSIERLRSMYQVEEGIEYLLKQAIKEADSFSVFVERVKSKRYTYTRIQRMCTYILCGVTKEEMQNSQMYTNLRLLGSNSIGRNYLKSLTKERDVSVISKISKRNKDTLALDIKCGEVYQLGQDKINSQDFGRHPIIVK